tara:strand:+ start:393 stop:971 length:579 start_codon:yes stop_codon:yes gene_type:complete
MPSGRQVTTILTFDAQITSNFGGDISKSSTLDNNYAIADAISQAAVIRLTDIPADFNEAISIKVRLDNVRFDNPAGAKSNAATIRTTLGDGSTTFYTEDLSALVNRSVFLEGTERTTSNGSAAWTSTQLNDLQLGLEVTAAVPNIGNGVYIDFAYVEVTYFTPPPPSYDSTIGRVIMDSGTTILSGGTVILD